MNDIRMNDIMATMHPRFRIQRIAAAMNLPMLDQLGMRQEIDRIGMFKSLFMPERQASAPT